MMECEKCKYYDQEENICTVCDCWPMMACDEPLLCEKEKKNEKQDKM